MEGIFIPTKQQLDVMTSGTFYNRTKSKLVTNKFFTVVKGR